ncbi:hypothetical protein BX070DRAFT_252205 [Coemansia spiralis]|nr:hypothetical protein BX070DRAFT_252205 [Coemansia spiralis]
MTGHLDLAAAVLASLIVVCRQMVLLQIMGYHSCAYDMLLVLFMAGGQQNRAVEPYAAFMGNKRGCVLRSRQEKPTGSIIAAEIKNAQTGPQKKPRILSTIADANKSLTNILSVRWAASICYNNTLSTASSSAAAAAACAAFSAST